MISRRESQASARVPTQISNFTSNNMPRIVNNQAPSRVNLGSSAKNQRINSTSRNARGEHKNSNSQ